MESTPFVTMATPVIKLEPIRMGSLLAPASTSVGQKYVAPSKRNGVEDTGPIKVDLGVGNFPTLGSVPKKTAGWGKHVVKVSPEPSPEPSPVTEFEALPKPETMKDKIKEQIRQAELEEQKPREEDPYKMTREELVADGWAVLSMKPEDVRDTVWRLNEPITASLTSEDYYE